MHLTLVFCRLCNNYTVSNNAMNHLYSCIKNINNIPNYNIVVYGKYSILAYILAQEITHWDGNVEEIFDYIYDFAFDVYTYFYCKLINFSSVDIIVKYYETLGNFDSFCKAVLNNIKYPEIHCLRILPNIFPEHFEYHAPHIENLKIIFNEEQIIQLNQCETV